MGRVCRVGKVGDGDTSRDGMGRGGVFGMARRGRGGLATNCVLSLSHEDSRITQGGCSGRTRWSSSLDCLTTYTSFVVVILLLIHDHMSF